MSHDCGGSLPGAGTSSRAASRLSRCQQATVVAAADEEAERRDEQAVERGASEEPRQPLVGKLGGDAVVAGVVGQPDVVTNFALIYLFPQ